VGMEEDIRTTDFVDYQTVFSDALLLVGKGSSVSEALETCIKERYPLTCRDIIAEANSMLLRLKRERDWGSLRALRELAERPGLAEAMRAGSGAGRGARSSGAIADYRRVFSLAQRKRQAGYSLEDSLDMAVRELYPQTFRKVREQAMAYVRLAAARRNEHELRALRELAEDPSLLPALETPSPD